MLWSLSFLKIQAFKKTMDLYNHKGNPSFLKKKQSFHRMALQPQSVGSGGIDFFYTSICTVAILYNYSFS